MSLSRMFDLSHFTALNAPKFNIFNQKLRYLLFLHSKLARLSTPPIDYMVKFPMPIWTSK
eukprot:UN13345